MVLLERDPVLASLRQYAHEAAQGEGRLVLIAGEAGVGKSVLVERFQRDLPDARWSWGACDGLSTPRPLAPRSRRRAGGFVPGPTRARRAVRRAAEAGHRR
jgi:predicted ATPase